MNDNEPILAELRKLSAWADTQRKRSNWALIFAAVSILALIVFAVLTFREAESKIEDSTSTQKPDWYEVDQNVRLGDFDKAIRIGETSTENPSVS